MSDILVQSAEHWDTGWPHARTAWGHSLFKDVVLLRRTYLSIAMDLYAIASGMAVNMID